MSRAGSVAEVTAFINHVITATEYTFGLMLQCGVVRRNLRLFDFDRPTHSISVVIPLSGSVEGTLGLSFSQDAANQLIKRLIGEDANDSHLGQSAAVELCSVIAEQTTIQHGGDLQFSPPEVCPLLELRNCAPRVAVATEFDSDLGPFLIVFAVSSRKELPISPRRVIQGRTRRNNRIEYRRTRNGIDTAGHR